MRARGTDDENRTIENEKKDDSEDNSVIAFRRTRYAKATDTGLHSYQDNDPLILQELEYNFFSI